ncbi:hypothetical protein Ahy_B06g083783 [Arachis hypogaea]|uniref:Uncharacterized protein n=1 Tax=Arachis hypogaea TaxID=3818 RepID=A0A444YQK7_ARAHY|nr:hypothetical protein Ahy_B06g083783 [Arachis hypogaea]
MSSSSGYLVVSVNPNCRLRNSDNENLILSSVSGSARKKIERVGYRLLAPTKNEIFRFRLFLLHGDKHVRLMFDIHRKIIAEQVMELFAEVGDVSSNFVQDDPPLAPKPLHVASPVKDIDVDDKDSNEEYVVDSNESGFSEDDEEEEFILETVEASCRYLLPALDPIQVLSSVPSHYATDVRRVEGAHTCLAPTMSQDPQQLDSSLICHIIFPLIQSNPSVSISGLQGAVRQSYHFKPSYRKVWMVKQKEESYNKVSRLLQAQLSCCPGSMAYNNNNDVIDGDHSENDADGQCHMTKAVPIAEVY